LWTPCADRFRIIAFHKKGGLGKVSVALGTELGREVAFKEIRDEYAYLQSSRDRFLLEAEITGRLEHPGIVPVYGLGHFPDGRPFYAMRFIRGNSLKVAISQFHATEYSSPLIRRSDFRKLVERFLDVCEAVEYAHNRGVFA
jgi:eukaryotic-like serine/threonine-protein kinase